MVLNDEGVPQEGVKRDKPLPNALKGATLAEITRKRGNVG